MNIQPLLEKSACKHSRLCPRQILGVRLGLLGMKTLGFDAPPPKKRLLTIVETDGCFVDGIIAATDCTVGHRTLRLEDYGKTAAVFVDTVTGQAFRVAPALDVREKACACAAAEQSPYLAQMQAYQVLPDHEMFTVTQVALKNPIATIVSHPGVRVNCGLCGEEIMNEREIRRDGAVLCRACAGGSYYQAVEPASLAADLLFSQPVSRT